MNEGKGLTEKQKRFCDNYIRTGNATQSAISAGYKKKTAGAIACENLKKPKIKEYIEEKSRKLEDKMTASMKEVSEFITSVMRDEEEKMAERLKAADMLIKTKGGYLEKIEAKITELPIIRLVSDDND